MLLPALVLLSVPVIRAQQVGARCVKDDCAAMLCPTVGEVPVCSQIRTQVGEVMECECGAVTQPAPKPGTFDPRSECGGPRMVPWHELLYATRNKVPHEQQRCKLSACGAWNYELHEHLSVYDLRTKSFLLWKTAAAR